MIKINVLMSTYNGEKYITEQIESILNQIGVETFLTIRDDGSSDNTIRIIEDYKSKYPDRFEIILGKNVGYKKSFLKLLNLAKEKMDFYAFSDQDDVWMPDKCIHGVRKIQAYKNECVLYASSVYICNENLEVIYINDMTSTYTTLKSDFVRHRIPGCTMIFSDELRKKAAIITKKMPRNVPSHDFVISAMANAFGKIYLDEKSYILHRRLKTSITSKEKGIRNRIQTEIMLIWKYKYESTRMALLLIKGNGRYWKLSKEQIDFIELVLKQRKTFRARLKLILDNQFTCGIKICDFETYFKILIGNF